MTRTVVLGRYRPGVGSAVAARAERYGVSVVAACCAAGALVENALEPAVTIGAERYDRGPDLAIVAAALGAAVLVALRGRLRIWGPLSALGLLGLAALPAPAWVLDSSFVFLFVMLTCGITGYLVTGPVAAALSLAAICAVGVLAEVRHPGPDLGHGLVVVGFMAVSWCVGLLVRRPVAEAHVAQEKALRLEREQAEAAERAVREERQRIARELHDIIAHSVSVMTVQAGAVRRLLGPDQERERASLVSVEQTGRDALAEMRRLVGLLKEEDAAPAYSPQPGLHALDTLVRTVREAGLPVEVDEQGERRDLPPGLDLTAFRVVQEALTNALKHAGPTCARVGLQWAADALVIEVVNDGSVHHDGPSTGYGSAGMRERVSLYGGRLEAGPRPDSGYAVRAVLPLGGAG